jgi:hypothetical protein
VLYSGERVGQVASEKIAEDLSDRHRVPNDPMSITAALFVIAVLEDVVGAEVT